MLHHTHVELNNRESSQRTVLQAQKGRAIVERISYRETVKIYCVEHISLLDSYYTTGQSTLLLHTQRFYSGKW